MAECKTCGTDPAPTGAAGGVPAVFNYTAKAERVIGLDGLSRSILQPLVEEENRGAGGHEAAILVNGQQVKVDGNTFKETYANAANYYKANGVSFKPKDLWLNLNLQWIPRGVQKKLKVSVANLMTIVEEAGAEVAPVAATKARPNTPPKIWGRKGWGMLQMYLAKDSYDYGTFLYLATELGTWVDPDKSPSIGCADCYRHYAGALARLRKTPLYTQLEARQWLFTLMNDVKARNNAPQLTYEQAALANHWT